MRRLILAAIFSIGCNQTPPPVEPEPEATLIGTGDGSATSVTFTVIVQQDQPRQPVALAFNPQDAKQLWVINRLNDSVLIVTNPGAADMSQQTLRDPAAEHFMNNPATIAFGAPGTWATCGENGGNDPGFMGPALFSSDLTVFAKRTAGGLGSHLDMLHDSPFCMGVAHEKDNVYWAFDGENSSLTQYDFAIDHGPGADDHSDGTILRYVAGQVKREPGVPSHMVFDGGQLYVADTGNKRLVKLDTQSGTPGGALPNNEPLVAHRSVDGATLSVLVAPGTLEQPSGLVLHGGFLYVSDHATSKIHAFDLTGRLVRSLDTGLPARSLAGLAVGPDAKIYLVDVVASRVLRIDPIL
jgi:hypothetical protein